MKYMHIIVFLELKRQSKNWGTNNWINKLEKANAKLNLSHNPQMVSSPSSCGCWWFLVTTTTLLVSEVPSPNCQLPNFETALSSGWLSLCKWEGSLPIRHSCILVIEMNGVGNWMGYRIPQQKHFGEKGRKYNAYIME